MLTIFATLFFAAEKVQVKIPNRLPTATNLETIPRDFTPKWKATFIDNIGKGNDWQYAA